MDAEAEEDLQRRELQRLLSTAKDEDRRSMITKAISALDITEQPFLTHEESTSGREKFLATLHPSIHSSIFESESIPVIEKAVGGNSIFKRRPLSAVKGRRPSMSTALDIIPERVVSLKNKSPSQKEVKGRRVKRDSHCTHDDRPTSSGSISSVSSKDSDTGDSAYLYYEDIQDVVASSCDARYPPKGVFVTNSGGNSMSPHSASRHSSPNHSHSQPYHLASKPHIKNSWSATGLLSQFFKVQFVEKWIITKIEVRCAGINSLHALVHSSAVSPLSAAKVLPMKRTANNVFSIDLASASTGRGSRSNSKEQEHHLGVTGSGVTLAIHQLSPGGSTSTQEDSESFAGESRTSSSSPNGSSLFVTIHELRIKVLPHT